MKKHGVLHLFYAGGSTNECIVMRPVGMRNMKRHGYNLILLRDATFGHRYHVGEKIMDGTEHGIFEVELQLGFTGTVDNFMKNAFSIL